MTLAVGFVDLIFSKISQVLETCHGEPKGALGTLNPNLPTGKLGGGKPGLQGVLSPTLLLPVGPGTPSNHHADAWLCALAKSWARETFHLVHFLDSIAERGGKQGV